MLFYCVYILAPISPILDEWLSSSKRRKLSTPSRTRSDRMRAKRLARRQTRHPSNNDSKIDQDVNFQDTNPKIDEVIKKCNAVPSESTSTDLALQQNCEQTGFLLTKTVKSNLADILGESLAEMTNMTSVLPCFSPGTDNPSDACDIANLPQFELQLATAPVEPNHPPAQVESKLIYQVKKNVSDHSKVHFHSPWDSSRSIEAANFNLDVLKLYDFDLEKVMAHLPTSIFHPGSEFRPTSVLQPLLEDFYNWDKLKSIITNGIVYPADAIDETDRLCDIQFMLDRGNHKSALDPLNAAALDKAFNKELAHGWSIVLPPDQVHRIKHASITPLGVATQWTIDSSGNRIIKRRATHDCSFPGPSGNSINSRMRESELELCPFAHCLQRILHKIHAYRIKYPNKAIFIRKDDIDAAYRRIHTAPQSAVTAITVLEDLAFLLFRLPFGVSPAAGDFSVCSEAIKHLATAIGIDPSWDPSELVSRFHNPDISTPTRYESGTAFPSADPLRVTVDTSYDLSIDVYIDDLITICIDKLGIPARALGAVPLAIDAIFRPVQSDEPVSRSDLISPAKQAAEGNLSETHTVLGWTIDTRLHRVFLPEDKAKDWLHDLEQMISSHYTSSGQLYTVLGRLTHIAGLWSTCKYYLPRLQYRLTNDGNYKHKSKRIHLASWDIADLKLWRHFIQRLQSKGMSINNIVATRPTSYCVSDASEFGLGGYTSSGLAWRFAIPEESLPYCIRRINLLEFIAAVVTIETELRYGPPASSAYHHLLALSDSSSALGWLHRSTFRPIKSPLQDVVARHLGTLLMDFEASHVSAHIKGKNNIIADSLSRDIDLSDTA